MDMADIVYPLQICCVQHLHGFRRYWISNILVGYDMGDVVRLLAIDIYEAYLLCILCMYMEDIVYPICPMDIQEYPWGMLDIESPIDMGDVGYPTSSM